MNVLLLQKCSVCGYFGAVTGCYSAGCTRKYHVLCARNEDCFFRSENFSIFCPKHKVSPDERNSHFTLNQESYLEYGSYF